MASDDYIDTIQAAIEYFKQEYLKKYNRPLYETGRAVRARAKYNSMPTGLVSAELVDHYFENSLGITENAFYWVILRTSDWGGWANASGLSPGHSDYKTYGFTIDESIYKMANTRSLASLIEVLRDKKIQEFPFIDITNYVNKHNTLRENPRFPRQWDVGFPAKLGHPFISKQL